MSIDNCSLITDNCLGTGKGVKVAVIDSGINLKFPITKSVKKSIGIGYRNDKVYHHRNINDEIGHGTKICDIILSIAPDVELYIAKIFDKRLIAEMDCLVKGIEWAINKKVNIINISLGTTSTRDLKDLKSICEEAHEKNIFIVSSLDNRNKISYPGWFKNVICVYNNGINRIKKNKNYLVGFGNGYYKYSNSYLAPIISAYCASFKNSNSNIDIFNYFKGLIIRE